MTRLSRGTRLDLPVEEGKRRRILIAGRDNRRYYDGSRYVGSTNGILPHARPVTVSVSRGQTVRDRSQSNRRVRRTVSAFIDRETRQSGSLFRLSIVHDRIFQNWEGQVSVGSLATSSSSLTSSTLGNSPTLPKAILRLALGVAAGPVLLAVRARPSIFRNSSPLAGPCYSFV